MLEEQQEMSVVVAVLGFVLGLVGLGYVVHYRRVRCAVDAEQQ